MSCARSVVVPLTILAIALPAVAQQVTQERQVISIGPDSPPPDLPGFFGQRQFKTGTGRIRGRALDASTGAPVRRAQLRISGPDIAPKTALTNADGRYEFRDLPAGRFTLTATKAGYVTIEYGQTRPFESGKRIDLADKQVFENADIAMPHGGVISGRVIDEFGEPVAEATVTSMRQTWSGGRRRLTMTGRTAQTNDLGQFRLYGLPPGDYFVSATLRGAETFVLDVMAGGSGGVGASGTTSGYAPTYFPGTATASEAQKIAVAPGQEVSGADFALLPVRLARVTGSVVGSDGKPLDGAMVTLVPASRGAEGPAFMLGNTTRTNKDGAFTLSSVTPGEYSLQVRTLRIVTAESGPGNFMFSARVGGEGDEAEFGSIPLSVAGEDLPNVVVVTSKGGTATGRITFDGVPRPNTFGTMRVTASAPDVDGPVAIVGGSSAAVKPDATFELKGVAGPRLIRVMQLPPGTLLKAVHLNGTDVTDTPVDFKNAEQVSGLEIVIGKSTELAGSVSDAAGRPVKDYTVVVFADDPQKWTAPMTRWVTAARPDQDGRFKITSLPAGSYYAVALEYIAQGEWGDPDLLDRLKTKAKPFTLDEGAAASLDLKISDM